MPIVPKYEQNQTRSAPLANASFQASASLEAFGGGNSAEGVTQAQNSMLKVTKDIFEEEKRKANEVVNLSSNTDLAGAEPEINKVVDSLRGENAFKAPDEAKKIFDSRAAAIEKRLSNDDQILAFQRIKASRWEDIDRRVQAHVGNEAKTLQKEKFTALKEYEQNAAIDSPYDELRIAKAIESQRVGIAQMAKIDGLDSNKEYMDNALLEVSSKTHLGVIRRRQELGNDLDAKAYYEKNKDFISGKDKIAIEKELQIGSVRAEAQSIADQYFSKYGTDEVAALSAIKSIKDVDIRDEAWKRYQMQSRTMTEARDQREKQNFHQAIDILKKSGGRGEIPPSVLANISKSQADELKARRELMINGIRSTDKELKYRLLNMVTTPEGRTAIQKGMDLEEFRSKLEDNDFDEIERAWRAVGKNDAESQKLLVGVQSKADIVNSALKSMNIDPKSPRAYEFKSALDRKVLAEQAASGKPATSDQIQKWSEDLQIEGKVKGTGILFEDSKRAFELQPGQQQKLESVGQVPPYMKRDIMTMLFNKGYPVTDKNIFEAYKEYLARKAKASGGK
jgi:hypothetical protein